MTDQRDTGEHFLDLADNPPDVSAQMSARRIADLATQIDFLDREIARYREIVEHERIRHSTELADLQVAADTQFDDLRRDERRATQAVHESYRALLAERQLEYEDALSRAASSHAIELSAERQRFEEILKHERTRREVDTNATRQRTADELNEAHHQSRQKLTNDLDQATRTVERLQGEIDDYVARANDAMLDAQEYKLEVGALHRRLAALEKNYQTRITEAEADLTKALERVDAERARSAATLSELLERSATIASEADRARSEFVAKLAASEHTAASAADRARAEYGALADAADARASRALEREAELEAAIAELRAHGAGGHA